MRKLGTAALTICLIQAVLMIQLKILDKKVSSIKTSHEVKTSCITDYKVVYTMNEVPDWYEKPAAFCREGMAVPISTALFPLSYKLSSETKFEHASSWFYIIWGCYEVCK